MTLSNEQITQISRLHAKLMSQVEYQAAMGELEKALKIIASRYRNLRTPSAYPYEKKVELLGDEIAYLQHTINQWLLLTVKFPTDYQMRENIVFLFLSLYFQIVSYISHQALRSYVAIKRGESASTELKDFHFQPRPLFDAGYLGLITSASTIKINDSESQQALFYVLRVQLPILIQEIERLVEVSPENRLVS